MFHKDKYYDIHNLIKKYPYAHYYISYGERSNGKTYSALKYCAERFFRTGEQFAYIRRFGEDIKPKNLATLFAAHCENGLISQLTDDVYSLVNYTRGKFLPARVVDDKIEMSSEPMGYAFDLNSMEHHKSTSYPKITTIVFDEFLSRQGYIPNEFVLFMNMISTIVRDRSNVKILMLGNTVNKYCPYFKEMGLTHIQEQKQGSIDVYNYSDTGLSVVVEYCDSIAKKGGKSSDVYFAFDNPQLKMITTGAWEIAIYPHLEERYRPKDIMFNFFISFNDNLLHGEIITTENNYFMFIHPKTTPIQDECEDIIYTDKPNQKWNYRVGIRNQSDTLSRIICKLLNENRVFYSDNETGEVLRNYLLWSADYVSARNGSN